MAARADFFRVDLRVGGGAKRGPRHTIDREGRSPRGRRSLITIGFLNNRMGSISAWAEEPRT